MACKVEITSAVRRELKKLPSDLQQQVLDKITSLGNVPLPPGVEKMSGSRHGYRIRAIDYRIAYLLMDDVVVIVKVAHRSEVYKDILSALDKAARKRWKE